MNLFKSNKIIKKQEEKEKEEKLEIPDTVRDFSQINSKHSNKNVTHNTK
jgi:hypothetical protein